MADTVKWEDAHAARIERFRQMGEDEWLKRNAKAMLDLEIIWLLAQERLCDQAGDDRTGKDAALSAQAGEVFFQLKALHRKMDLIAAEAMGAPMARSGAR